MCEGFETAMTLGPYTIMGEFLWRSAKKVGRVEKLADGQYQLTMFDVAEGQHTCSKPVYILAHANEHIAATAINEGYV